MHLSPWIQIFIKFHIPSIHFFFFQNLARIFVYENMKSNFGLVFKTIQTTDLVIVPRNTIHHHRYEFVFNQFVPFLKKILNWLVCCFFFPTWKWLFSANINCDLVHHWIYNCSVSVITISILFDSNYWNISPYYNWKWKVHQR